MKRFIYYDTETTGIKRESDRIIEIAAYDPAQEKTLEMLVNPGIPIPPEATAIHNISDEMVKEAPPFSEVAEAFKEFCDGEPILVAHNNDGFDIHFLREEFKRCGQEMPSWTFLDSLKWARRYRPDLPRHSLQFLREIYGIPENNAHRALDDVIVLEKVFSLMLDDLTPEQALELLKAPRAVKEMTRMPFGKHQGKPLTDVPASYVRWLAEQGALDKEENLGLKMGFEKAGLLEPAAAAPN